MTPGAIHRITINKLRPFVVLAPVALLVTLGVSFAFHSVASHEARSMMAAAPREDGMTWTQTVTDTIANQPMHACGQDRDCWTAKLPDAVASYARDGFSAQQREELAAAVLARAGDPLATSHTFHSNQDTP